MTSDQRLVSERFPRSSQYHPDWVVASASGGANVLWVTEWLTSALDLHPGMRVLDLGCGRASSSIFMFLLFDSRPARFSGGLEQLDLRGFPPYDTPRYFEGIYNAERVALPPG